MAAQERKCDNRECGREFAPKGNQRTCSVECSREVARAGQRSRRSRSAAAASAGRIDRARAEVEAAGKLAEVGTLAGLWELAEAVEAAQVEAVTRLRADGHTWDELAEAVGKRRGYLYNWHTRAGGHVSK